MCEYLVSCKQIVIKPSCYRAKQMSSLWGNREATMRKEYFDPNFIGPILPPKNLTDEQKAAYIKVLLSYSSDSLIYMTDRSKDASQAIAS